MSISLKQAFSFVPNDAKWITKILIGGLLLFFPTFVYVFPGIKRLVLDPINYYMLALFAMLVFVSSSAVCGYFFKTVHNRIVHLNGHLPSWKHFTYYIYVGIKAYLGGLILAIPFMLIMAVFAFFTPMTIGKELIPFALIALLLHVFYTIFYIMLALNFSLDFRINSFFNIKKAYSLIKNNLVNYAVLVCYCLVVAMINFVATVILLNAQIFMLLLPFVSFYICLVYTDLFAQFELNLEGEDCREIKCYS